MEEQGKRGGYPLLSYADDFCGTLTPGYHHFAIVLSPIQSIFAGFAVRQERR